MQESYSTLQNEMEKRGKEKNLVGYFWCLDQHAAGIAIRHGSPILSIAARSALFFTGVHVDVSLPLLSRVL